MSARAEAGQDSARDQVPVVAGVDEAAEEREAEQQDDPAADVAGGLPDLGHEADDTDPNEDDRKDELIARRPAGAMGQLSHLVPPPEHWRDTFRPRQGRDCSVPSTASPAVEFGPSAKGLMLSRPVGWKGHRVPTMRRDGNPSLPRDPVVPTIRGSTACSPSSLAASRSSTGSSSGRAARLSSRRPRLTSGRSAHRDVSTPARSSGPRSPSGTPIRATQRPIAQGGVRLRLPRDRAGDLPPDLRAAAGRAHHPAPHRLAADR